MSAVDLRSGARLSRLVAAVAAVALVGTGALVGTSAGAAPRSVALERGPAAVPAGAALTAAVPAGAALTAADETVASNVALIAAPTVSFVPGWNRASALNDGTELTPDGHGSVWGTYSDFVAQHWAQYDWEWPVTVDRSAVWFWNDVASAGNVQNPAAWHLEYRDASGQFQPVSTTTYPIATGAGAILGPNEVTFTPVTTTALRLVLDAEVRGDPDPYYAVASTEWQVWGTGGAEPEVPVDPNAPIAVEDVAVRTLVGQVPTLPDEVWVLPENGPLAYVDAMWDPVPADAVDELGTALVEGAAGDTELAATVHVVADLASPVEEVDHTTTVTTPGVAPVCARTVTAWHADGSAASTTPVTWDAIDPADYADAESLFAVEGAVSGFAPRVECTVWVVAPTSDDEGPGVAVDVDSAPASSGWYTASPQVSVRVVEGGAPVESVEVRIGSGDWQPYTEPVTVEAEGTVAVAARATDSEDRTGEATRTLKVDTRAPVTEVAHALGATSATFTLTPTDPEPGSGLARTLFSYGPSADPESSENVMWATYEEPFGVSLDQDATVYVHVRSQDLAGHQEQTRTTELAPVAPMVVTPAAPVLTAPRCVEGEVVDGSIAVPSVPGVVYTVDGQAVSGAIPIAAGATVRVEARPATGYAFAGEAQVVEYLLTATTPDCTPDPREVEPGTVTVAGQARVDQRLTATAAGWGPPGVRLGYQWYASGKAVAGATARTLVVAPAHVGKRLAVRVTGSGDGLVSRSLLSGQTAVVVKATFVAPRPTIAGTVAVGKTVTARTGTWKPVATLTYRWYADGKPISGATKSTLRLSKALAGKKLTVRVTGSRPGYVTASVVSPARTWRLQSSTPRITGTPAVGRTLRALPGTWTAGTRLTYQWKVDGVAIKGASGQSYKVRAADRGDRITVSVTGTKKGYTTATRTSPGVRIR
ncbi:hypothetical protein ACFP82_15935 [Cellulomonas gelida]|uniref:hypothetical protein n=1 Tax=Cellulomonas gelida TaxID=1712 RepID=UPI003622BECA